MLRILVASVTRQIIGGVETYLQALISHLRKAGHQVTFAYEHEALEGTECVVNERAEAVRLEADWGQARRAMERPDVVLLNGLLNTSLEQGLIRWAPTAYFAHAFLGTCVSGTKRWSRPSTQVCERKFGVGCLLHYLPHGCGGKNLVAAVGFYSDQHRRLQNIRMSRALVVASKYMAREYCHNGISKNVHVLPYFVEPGVWTARKELPVTTTLLFVGRVTELKGLDLLVRAARRLADATRRACRVVAAGDGPKLRDAEKLATELRVPFESHGWVDQRRRDELFQRATLLAIPSTWPEPFGLVGLEAGRYAVPTVAFPVGGIGEWLRPGVNGEFASRPGDSDALADALLLATAERTRYGALADGARRELERFSPDAHLSQLLTLLERVADHGSE
jgi:glycosyltransferase involved in cell wall biosynthesis